MWRAEKEKAKTAGSVSKKERESMKKRILGPLALVLVLALSVTARAGDTYIDGYFRYTLDDGSVTVTAYTGRAATVAVPPMMGGNPVNTIAAGAFADNAAVTRVYLPDTVTTVREGAFGPGQTAVFYYLTPELADAEKSAEGTRVTVFAKPGLLLLCAAYDGDGRMLASRTQTVAPGQTTYRFPLGGESTVKVFLLDEDYRPQCPCLTR